MEPRKKVLIYNQHMFGSGHFFRSAQLANGLSHAHDVTFVNGGRSVASVSMSPRVKMVSFPAVFIPRKHRAESHQKRETPTRPTLNSEKQGVSTRTVLTKRREILTSTVRELRPDVVLIEFFPFGCWAVTRECRALIRTAKRVQPTAKIVCSIRDFPITSAVMPSIDIEEQLRRRFSAVRTARNLWIDRNLRLIAPLLNRDFHSILVHSDPRVSDPQSHIPFYDKIRIPVVFTGYVSQAAPRRTSSSNSGAVVVSSGAAPEDTSLAILAVEAWNHLTRQQDIGPREMVLFSPLFEPDARSQELEDLYRGNRLVLKPFSSEFLGTLKDAALSISRGGYNTCVNVLETRTPAIVIPNPWIPDQYFRATRLHELGLVQCLLPSQLTREVLAKSISEGLKRETLQHDIDLNGVSRTCEHIAGL